MELPDKKYKTILIDPPWNVGLCSRHVRPFQKEFPYKRMKLSEIKKLPIDKIADKQCHLYLWTTHKFLPKAFELLKEWNFEYHCVITWDKTFGFTPFSFMWSTEFCLFAQRPNNWLDLKRLGKKALIRSKPNGHSEKPKAMYSLIEEVSYPPRIELFARDRRDGWDWHGDQLSSTIQKLITM